MHAITSVFGSSSTNGDYHIVSEESSSHIVQVEALQQGEQGIFNSSSFKVEIGEIGLSAEDLTKRIAGWKYNKLPGRVSKDEKTNVLAVGFNISTVLLTIAVFAAIFGGVGSALVYGSLALFTRWECEKAIEKFGTKVNNKIYFLDHAIWKNYV